MIIAGEEKRNGQGGFTKLFWVKVGVAALVLAGILWAIVAFVQREKNTFPGKVICDAETVDGNFFVTNGVKFKGGITQSADWAFTGKYSSKVWENQKFGITYSVHYPKAGEIYKARTWVRRPAGWDGFLVGASPDGKTLRVSCDTPKRSHLGWDLFEITVSVPSDYKFDRIDFYVYSNKEVLYFDDFSIEKVTFESDYQSEVFRLNIADKWMKKLQEKRAIAMGDGLLLGTDDDWIEGEIQQENGQNLAVELRLKGDWLDHLKTDKWSYRIKVSGEGAWNRMKTFSIQQPGARNFLDEWVFHQLLEKIDILTPRYDFMEVYENGTYKGIYAYEEHFDKQLLEYKKRREGPIVKFAEDVQWQNVYRSFMTYKLDPEKERSFTYPRDAAQIKPFKEGKTAKSTTLLKQFEQAEKLMQQYRYGEKSAEEIFDLDMMAKYYAAVDIMSAYHGIFWTNTRYYYNPVTSKLEPIGYDGYSQGHDMSWYRRTFIGQRTYNEKFDDGTMLALLFKDEKFIEKYTAYLYQYSSRDFFEPFMDSLENGILKREALLQQDYTDYKFDFDKMMSRVRDIRTKLEPYKDYSIQVYVESKTAKSQQLKVTNFHVLPLRVIGFGKSPKKLLDTLANPLLLYVNLKQQTPVYQDLETKTGMKYVFYELPGKDSIYTAPISPWIAPTGETAFQKIFNQPTIITTDIYQVIGKKNIFNKGKYTVTKDIIFPEGYNVLFPSGVALNFIKKAKFISKSPVTMMGSEEAPILIQSTDFSANGFTVLQAASISKMTNVTFKGFNTLTTNGWNLTGAVTFYESDVNMNQCRFIKNRCEDGLNIVRSNFDITGLIIGETFSDGLDIDFGKGTLRDVYFYKTGNDGMDFSGSTITIENGIIKDAGDKGISVGEESTVHIKNIHIDGANIGVASKDLSRLVIDFIDLKRCNQGFTAFQKKPEYGGATIEIKDYKATEIRFLHKIQVGSKLTLKGEEVDNS
jgi:hypothetical protein